VSAVHYQSPKAPTLQFPIPSVVAKFNTVSCYLCSVMTGRGVKGVLFHKSRELVGKELVMGDIPLLGLVLLSYTQYFDTISYR